MPEPEPDLTLFDNHETGSKERYCKFQKRLNEITNDDKALKILADKVDIQLKLEDFLVKSRQANHPKAYLWGLPAAAFIVPAVIAALVSLGVAWLKH
jgi:hypothetical protein